MTYMNSSGGRHEAPMERESRERSSKPGKIQRRTTEIQTTHAVTVMFAFVVCTLVGNARAAQTADPRFDISTMNSSGLENAVQFASAKKGNSWSVRPTVSPDCKDLGVQVAFRYTGGGAKEFLWGLSRPVHIYNTNEDGKKEVLPFYSRPIKAGGALSPLNPGAWRENPALTGGALAADLAIVAGIYAATKSDSDSDSRSSGLESGKFVPIGTASNDQIIYQNTETGAIGDASGDTSWTVTGDGYVFVGESGSGSGDDNSITDPNASTGGGSGGSDGNSGDVPDGGSGNQF